MGDKSKIGQARGGGSCMTRCACNHFEDEHGDLNDRHNLDKRAWVCYVQDCPCRRYRPAIVVTPWFRLTWKAVLLLLLSAALFTWRFPS